MSQRVSFVLFLLLCYHTSWLVCAKSISSSAAERVTLFERGVTTVPYEDKDGRSYERVVHSFRIPSLVNVNGVMVAIADARYDDSNDNTFIDTVAKFSVDNGSTWTTQIAVKNNRGAPRARVVDPTVVVKDNKIYIFVASYNSSGTYWKWHSGKDWDPLLAVGEVEKTTKDGKLSANIKWNKPQKIDYTAPALIRDAPLEQFLGGVGVAIITKNGTLVFPIQIKNTRGGIYSTIMYSVDDGKTWKIANGMTLEGCTEPSILEWEGKLIMNTRLDIGYRKVFESTDMGETWKEVRTTLSRVWGNSPSRKGPGSQSAFINVEIEGKRVMLLTNPLNHKGDWERDRLHLWLTDNNRIFDVGQISIDDENAAYSSLLYKDGKLYCLHEINHGEKYSLVFLELKEELDLIKSVVKTWIDQDKNFTDICTPTKSKTDSDESDCGVPFPTSGLVGFLSDKVESGYWKDTYRCVDAEVRDAERVPNGLTFKGGYSAGARWPVSKQGQNRRYNFVNYAFTLVATVRIDGDPQTKKPIPLLGVSLDEWDYNKVLALSYSHGGRWNPMYGKTSSRPTGSWELNRTYQVVFTLSKNVGSIYINGETLEGSGKNLLYNTRYLDISHIFMGGTMRYGVKSGHVTVTNVLLYNRELNQSEIKTLLAFKDTNVATAKKRPKEVLTETIPSLLPTPSLTESTTEGGVVPTQSKGIKPPMERVQSSGTDRISGGHTAGHGPKSGDVQKKSTDNNGPDSNGAPSAGKTTKSEITTGPGETVSVPSVSPVKEDDKKEEEDQSLRHGSTAQTNVNVMNGNDTFDRTGISSATHKSPSAVQPEKPESPTVVNHKDSVPDVTVEKEEDENKSNCDSDSSNRGTSIGIEKNEIKNNNPSEGSESTKEESPKNTMDASKEDTVTPTEATHQSIDVPNTYAHHVSKLSGADGSFYFNSSLPLIILLGSTLVVVLF